MGYGNKDVPEMMNRLRVNHYDGFSRFRLLDDVSGAVIMIKATSGGSVMQVTWLPASRPEHVNEELLPSLLFKNEHVLLDEALDFALDVARTNVCDEMYTPTPLQCNKGYKLETA